MSDVSVLNTKVCERVGKDSEKYRVALKFVNRILVNIGKEEVDDLTDFVGVDRDDIIKDVNKKSLEEMEGEIFPLFNKLKCGYYRKTGSFVLNCLRGILKEIGFEMTYTQKEKNEIIGDRSYKRTHSFYSIK